MIFKQIDEILSGKKTQTRRMVKEGETLQRDYATSDWRVVKAILTPRKNVKYRQGKEYAIVPKRGAKSITNARIFINDIRQEHLQSITEADARAEGVDSVAVYRELWQSINGKTKGARWEDNPLVWVITFEAVRA